MAKTDWNSPPKWITPDFMVAFAGNNAGSGHNHQGTDDDGSCPNIALSNAVSDYITGTFGIDVSSTYYSTPASNKTAVYTKIGNVVTILFQEGIWGWHSTNDQLRLSPNGGSWPSDIIPTTDQLVSGMFLGRIEGAATEFRPGAIVIPNSVSTDIICYIIDDTGEFKTDNFGTGSSGGLKGVQEQSITYLVD